MFSISQHSRDEALMNSLIDFLRCGNCFNYNNTVDFRVRGFSDNEQIIIPFFDKYPLQGIKYRDYKDFVKVAEIMKNKGHLTAEGIKNIKAIKSKMNTGRIYD